MEYARNIGHKLFIKFSEILKICSLYEVKFLL